MKTLDLKTQCARIVNDEAWIFSNEYNALFRQKLNSMNAEFVCSFDKEPWLAHSLFTKMLYCNNKLFFIPCLAESLARDLVIYDIAEHKTKYLPMPFKEQAVYYNVTIKNHMAIMFPVVYNRKAYLLDMNSESLEEIDIDFGEYDEIFKTAEATLFCGVVWYEHIAMYGIYNTPDILKFDMDNHSVSVEKNAASYPFYLLSNKSKILYGIDATGEHFIRFENFKEKEVQVLPYNRKGNVFQNGNEMAYTQNIILENGNILFIPARGNDILFVDGYGNINNIPVDWERVKCNKDEQAVATTQEYNGYVYAFPYQGNLIWKINIANKEVEYLPSKAKAEILENLTVKHWRDSERRTVNEKEMDLDIYLKVLAEWNKRNNAKESTVGKMIYQTVIN